MSIVLAAFLILLALVLVLALFVVGIYNRLVALRNRFKNAFAQIDVQLKRRYDLIPESGRDRQGLPEARARHARGRHQGPQRGLRRLPGRRRQSRRTPAPSRTCAEPKPAWPARLSRLMVVSEAYPDLKANQNMMQLTEELTSTENKISFARQAYNDSVMLYNTTRETFPNVVFAGMFGFTEAQLFQIEDQAQREAPKVSFS